MYWQGLTYTHDQMPMVVGVRVIDGKLMEFAGRGNTIAEAKNKALALMWRQSRLARGLPEEHVSVARTVSRLGGRP